MRTLGISAFVLAVVIATLSVIFVGLAYSDGWSGGHACSMAESLCRSPSLGHTNLAAIAWGPMLLVTDK
jgi:hypothetical protein